MTLTVFRPGVTGGMVLRERATSVTRWVAGLAGSTMLALFTVTPPVTRAEMWFAYPGPPASGPGSKNSGHCPPPVHSPFVHVGAVQHTETDNRHRHRRAPTHTGFVEETIVGGGGALSWTARTAQLFAGVSAYSWKVQIV